MGSHIYQAELPVHRHQKHRVQHGQVPFCFSHSWSVFGRIGRRSRPDWIHNSITYPSSVLIRCKPPFIWTDLLFTSFLYSSIWQGELMDETCTIQKVLSYTWYGRVLLTATPKRLNRVLVCLSWLNLLRTNLSKGVNGKEKSRRQ